jgi:hypothetical protein
MKLIPVLNPWNYKNHRMQIKCKMSTPDTQNNNFKDQCIKEDQRHRINMNRTDLLHFYVLLTNFLRRLYSQELNMNFILNTTITIRITFIAGIGNFTIIIRNTSAISVGSRYVMLLVRTCLQIECFFLVWQMQNEHPRYTEQQFQCYHYTWSYFYNMEEKTCYTNT